MKASLDRNGILTIEPESSTEEYALRHWANESTVLFPRDDIMNARQKNEAHWDYAKLIVKTHVG